MLRAYKEIQIDYSSTSEASEAINILSENFKKEDMWAEITGENIITLYINQVDFNKLNNLESGNKVISKIIEAIESISSYGIKGGKRIFVGYDSAKKVVNR